MNFIRKVLAYGGTVIVGILFAAVISWVVGLVWKAAAKPVFYVLAGLWIWTAWRYATMRDRGEFPPV